MQLGQPPPKVEIEPARQTSSTPRHVERHRINCPYCPIGYAMIFVEVHGKTTNIQGANDPRKCESCGKFFLLKINLKVSGRRLEDVNG